MKVNKQFFIVLQSVALLAGTTIGAGVLGIPYAIGRSGYWIGMLYLVVIGIGVWVLNLCLTEVVLRTKGNHQLPFLVGKYLGERAKAFTLVSMMILIYGALTAYMAGSGMIMANLLDTSPLLMSLIVFGLGCLLIYAGIRVVSKFELIFLIGIILIILAIALRGIFLDHTFQWHYLNEGSLMRWDTIFVPYGPVLFSYLGFVAIPEIKRMMRYQRQEMRFVISLGFLIPVFVYMLFVTVVLGTTGLTTTPIATLGLGRTLGPEVALIANLFGLIAMITGFLSLGSALAITIKEEFHLRWRQSFVLTVLPPLSLVLAGVQDFVKIISFAGAISGSILGIMIIFMYWKSKIRGDRVPEFSLGAGRLQGIVLIVLMLLGMISVAM